MNDIDPFADALDNAPSEDGLSRLSEMFRKRQELNDAIELMKVDLKEKEETLRKMDELQFPELFDEVGITSFSVGNRKVEVQEKLYGSLPKDEKDLEKALAILKANGGEALMKVMVSIDFNKGEADKAKETADLIKNAGFNPVVKESIHAATLQKWGREMTEKGAVIDLKEVGLYQRRFIKIT